MSEHALGDGSACTCGFVPSSMSDAPGETMALHICQRNEDCYYWTECRALARCCHRREQFPWLDQS